MSKSKWKRVQKGWYELEGTHLSVVNMRGEVIKYSGKMTPCWEVRVAGHVIGTYFTCAEAKRAAER